MLSFNEKVVFITGASSGIGEEIARQLARAGAKLAITARRRDALDAVADAIEAAGSPRPFVTTCDVTIDGDPERAVAEAVAHFGRLDIVFANAGFGVVGSLKRLTVEDYRRQFETNVFGVLRTLYAALPEVKKTRGNVVLIGSVAGWVATPGTSPYAMSKFAIRGLADAITPELRRDGVTVTLISPGFVGSRIRRRDNQGSFRETARDPLPGWLVVDTPSAVREILRAVARGKREQVVTGHGKILVLLQRFAPWAMRSIGRRFAGRPSGYRTERGQA